MATGAEEASSPAAVGAGNGIGSDDVLDDANNPESEKPPPVCGDGSEISESELGAPAVMAEGDTGPGGSTLPVGWETVVAGIAGSALVGRPKNGI